MVRNMRWHHEKTEVNLSQGKSYLHPEEHRTNTHGDDDGQKQNT